MPEITVEVWPMRVHKPHKRVIRSREISYTCAVCGVAVTKDTFPGPEPKYCDDCRREVKRQQNKERVRRHRANKRAEG